MQLKYLLNLNNTCNFKMMLAVWHLANTRKKNGGKNRSIDGCFQISSFGDCSITIKIRINLFSNVMSILERMRGKMLKPKNAKLFSQVHGTKLKKTQRAHSQACF